MPVSHSRLSELVVCSPEQTAEEIGQRLGLPPDEVDRDCWVTRVSGDDATDINSMTTAVLARLDASWSALEAIAAEDAARIVLRVVAYLSPTDRCGAGISFDASQVRQLASISAVLDFDLYNLE